MFLFRHRRRRSRPNGRHSEAHGRTGSDQNEFLAAEAPHDSDALRKGSEFVGECFEALVARQTAISVIHVAPSSYSARRCATRHRDPRQPTGARRTAIRKAVEATGATLLFTPSPDFNPIEDPLAKLGALLRGTWLNLI